MKVRKIPEKSGQNSSKSGQINPSIKVDLSIFEIRLILEKIVRYIPCVFIDFCWNQRIPSTKMYFWVCFWISCFWNFFCSIFGKLRYRIYIINSMNLWIYESMNLWIYESMNLFNEYLFFEWRKKKEEERIINVNNE